MTPFDQALALVHDTLSRYPEGSARASLASLEALVEVARATPAPAPTPAPPAAKAPAPTPTAPASPAPSQPAAAPVSLAGLAAQVRARLAPPPPASAPAPSGSSKAEQMEALRARVMAALPNEPLAHHRTRFVFGVGNPDAELMFVGEAPGADEEIAGEPFVGPAGQLLTKIITAMELSREQVYIGNILKWRPDMPAGASGNRKPRPDEMAACLPYLEEQIAIVEPKCLVALGATAMQGLTGATEPMHALRGRWHAFKGIPLMATYHPAYLLRNQSNSEKRKVWEDMLQVLELLGHPVSARQRGYFLSR